MRLWIYLLANIIDRLEEYNKKENRPLDDNKNNKIVMKKHKKEEEEKEEEEEEEKEEEEKIESRNEEIIKEKKCSLEEHSNMNSNSFCQECGIFMCIKCENHHSHLFKNHHLIKLNENKNEDNFKRIYNKKNNLNKLEYYCIDHNILCCSSCLCCIKSKGNGSHKDCNTC